MRAAIGLQAKVIPGTPPLAAHVRQAIAAGSTQAKPRLQAPAVAAGAAARPTAPAHLVAAAAVRPASVPQPRPFSAGRPAGAVQARVGFEYELGYIKTEKRVARQPERWAAHSRGEMIKDKGDYSITADSGPNRTSQLEYIIRDVDEDNPAACRRAVRAAAAIYAEIQDVAQDANVDNWVVGSATRLGTSPSHRFYPEQGMDKMIGQLQATAGLSVARLPEVVSGRAVLDARLSRSPVRQFLGNYNSRNVQPIWHRALGAVRQTLPRLTAAKQEVLASAVTMLVQVPLNFHGELPPGGQALFTAKTDFSKVLAEVFAHLGQAPSYRSFEKIVMDTINGVIRQGTNPTATLRPTDDMVAQGPTYNGQQLNGLSIRRWLSGLMPTANRAQGVDRFTSEHFPGTRAQRAELRGFGRLGNRVDAGSRPIFEFRNLSTVLPDQLPEAVEGMLDYIRAANNPPPPPQQQNDGDPSLLAAGILALGYLAVTGIAAASSYFSSRQ